MSCHSNVRVRELSPWGRYLQPKVCMLGAWLRARSCVRGASLPAQSLMLLLHLKTFKNPCRAAGPGGRPAEAVLGQAGPSVPERGPAAGLAAATGAPRGPKEVSPEADKGAGVRGLGHAVPIRP